MARRLRPDAVRVLVGLAAAAVLLLVVWIGWQRYAEERVVTEPEAGGPPVTQIVSARLAGASRLNVANLSGTVQSTASDVRGFGWLRSDQIVKMPYSVAYFIDMSRIGAGDMQWNAETRTLIVDAPDLTVDPPNTDEGRRTLVQTNGLFVTRKAAEELTRLTSLRAEGAARREANSPERLAQARELARGRVAALLAQPLAAVGYPGARVVVTFPGERGSSERWDTSRSVEEVLGNDTAPKR